MAHATFCSMARLYSCMSLNVSIPYHMPGTVTNPGLADAILHLLLSDETATYSAQSIADYLNVNKADIEEQIQEINDVKARWVYEIKYIDQSEKYYIIGNCKSHIREYLRKGGFTRKKDFSAPFSLLLNPAFKKQNFYQPPLSVLWLIAAAVLLAFVYIFTKLF